jgi:hypothetical protein
MTNDIDIQEVRRMTGAADHHRDQLVSLARDFVVKHGAEFNTCEADELFSVIMDGVDYDEAKRRIERIKEGRES